MDAAKRGNLMDGMAPMLRQHGGLKLRYYQNDAVDAAWDFLANGRGNGLIVLPTGTGKALTICELCRRAMIDSDGQARIFILTHAKELVKQNYEEMLNLWPEAPAGIYSA